VIEDAELGLVESDHIGVDHVALEKAEKPVGPVGIGIHAELGAKHLVPEHKLAKRFAKCVEVDFSGDLEGRPNPNGQSALLEARLPFNQVIIKFLRERRALRGFEHGRRGIHLRRRTKSHSITRPGGRSSSTNGTIFNGVHPHSLFVVMRKQPPTVSMDEPDRSSPRDNEMSPSHLSNPPPISVAVPTSGIARDHSTP
jgi:hypothetical protein